MIGCRGEKFSNIYCNHSKISSPFKGLGVMEHNSNLSNVDDWEPWRKVFEALCGLPLV